MKCPTCATVDLLMSERLGIEIDYCPTCRGVWLDRGELDKIIERTVAMPPVSANQPQPAPQQAQPRMVAEQFPRRGDHDHREGHHDDHDDHHGYGKHGRRSFLRELFD